MVAMGDATEALTERPVDMEVDDGSLQQCLLGDPTKLTQPIKKVIRCLEATMGSWRRRWSHSRSSFHPTSHVHSRSS